VESGLDDGEYEIPLPARKRAGRTWAWPLVGHPILFFSFLFPSDIWTTGSKQNRLPASACAQRPCRTGYSSRLRAHQLHTHATTAAIMHTDGTSSWMGRQDASTSSSQKSKSWQLVNTRVRSIVAWHVHRVRTDPMRSEHVSSSGS
jgi:hypothetical protein